MQSPLAAAAFWRGDSSEGEEVLHTKPQPSEAHLAMDVWLLEEVPGNFAMSCPLSHTDSFLYHFSKNVTQPRSIRVYISQIVKSAPKRRTLTFRRICYNLNFRAKSSIQKFSSSLVFLVNSSFLISKYLDLRVVLGMFFMLGKC